MEKRYLVYRSYNGKIFSEIQYGQHQTGEGIKTDVSEMQRIELSDHNLTLDQAIKIYPYMKEAIRQ